jgi:hypothetical protein
MNNWFENYVGKPWQANPKPPDSYNCGELLKSVYRDLFNIEEMEIKADAMKLSECVKAFQSRLFGLIPLKELDEKKEFDVVFMARSRYEDHCGLAANTTDGLLILHCLQSAGVVLESPYECLENGFSKLYWYRYHDLTLNGHRSI